MSQSTLASIQQIRQHLDWLEASILQTKEVPVYPAESSWLGKLVAAAAHVFGVTTADLLSDSRNRKLANARAAIIALARDKGHSWPAIGKALNRHHSSVIYLSRYFDRRMENYPEHRPQMKQILEFTD